MGTVGTQDGSGSRGQLFVGQQSVFDTPVAPTVRLRFKPPDSLAAQREFSVSEEPTAQRGRADITETSAAASGDLSYDLRTEGLGYYFKAALGGDVDVLTINNADAGVRCHVTADYTTGSTTLYVDSVAGFPAAGYLAIAYRTDGDITKALTSITNVEYTGTTGNAFVLAAPIVASTIKVEDYVVLYSSAYTGVRSHLYASGTKLSTILTFGLLRDIVAFYYYSCKIQTWTETYDNQAEITGTVTVAAGAEWAGGFLAAEALPGYLSLTIDNIDNDRRNFNTFYPSGGTIWIDNEYGITFTAASVGGVLSGIPASGTGAITAYHYMEPEVPIVAPMSMPNTALSVTDSNLASYHADVYWRIGKSNVDQAAIEVLNLDFTVENNLFLTKVPLGTKERAALPEGPQDVTGTLHVEFDSPLQLKRIIKGTKGYLRINAVDQLTNINSTGVRKGVYTDFPNIKYIGETPTIENLELIEHDMPFRALVWTRWGQVNRWCVNSQDDALAGG